MRRFVVFLVSLFCASPALAAISFTSGQWQTTFNCAEQTQFVTALNCDGMEWWHNYTLVPGHLTQVVADANHAAGAGGRGARFWIGTGQNNNTGTIKVQFPSYQKEFWVRWYIRHQAGYEFSSLEDDKNLYIYSAGNVTQVIPEYYTDSYRLASQSTPNPNPVITSGYGWNQVNGGTAGDGLWHCFEIHLKMDTNGANGVGHLWIDGVLRASNTSVNWSNNSATAQMGWDYFIFEENQKYISGGPYYVDYDDMIVRNTAPANADAQGNPMIGPIGWRGGGSGGTPPPVGVTPGNLIMSESFETAINGNRGWIDGNMSDIVDGGHSGNAMRWAWPQGATQPNNSNTVRFTLPADRDQLFVRMWMKYDANWVGSGVPYHPHMLYLVSNQDVAASAYGPLANNYLSTYVEAVSGTASPYVINPMIGFQDQKRVNVSNGTPPVDLRAITQNRSTGYCNQPAPLGWDGTCFADAPYYSASTFKSTASIPKNQWVQVDTFLKANTIAGGVGLADGKVKMWIDGVLVADSSDVMFRTNQYPALAWRQIVFGPWIGDGSPIAQAMYIDELAVYDGYVDSSGNITCYLDADIDGYGTGASESVAACSPGYFSIDHFVSLVGDCNDSAISGWAIHPGSIEMPNNGIDEDCSGVDLVIPISFSGIMLDLGAGRLSPGSGFFIAQ